MRLNSPLTSLLLTVAISLAGVSGALSQEFTFFAEQTAGSSDGSVRIDVLDPGATTGDNYRVVVSEAEGLTFFSVQNLTQGTTPVAGVPGDESSPVFDGIQVRLIAPQPRIKEVIEVAYGGEPVDPPVHVFRPGDRQGRGGNNSTGEFTFMAGFAGGVFASMASREAFAAPFDYELRFDGNPDDRNFLVYGFTAEGTIPVPFSLWNIGVGTPDDTTDDRQIVALGFDGSGNPTAYDGGAAPADGGPGTMFDLIYFFDLNFEAGGPGDVNGDGEVNYDDFLQDLEDNEGDLSPLLFSRAYLGQQVIRQLAMVALNEDVNFTPPTGTTIRFTTTKPLGIEDVFEFNTPVFGLFTNPIALSFDNVRVGQAQNLSLILKNQSSSTISVSNIVSTSPDFQPLQTATAISANDSGAISIRFMPSTNGYLTGSLAISSDDAFFPQFSLSVSGEGLPLREGKAIQVMGRIDIKRGEEKRADVTDVWGYFDEETGREYAVVGYGLGDLPQAGVSIVDVTEPARLREVAHLTDVPGFDVKVWRHYLYATSNGGANAFVVDISTPAQPEIVGSFQSSHNIFVSDSGLLISESPGVRIWDLNQDPTDPQLLWSGGFEGHDATVVGDILYDFHGGLGGPQNQITNIYDLKNPAEPMLLGAINDLEVVYHHSGWPTEDGNHLLVCDELGPRANSPIDIFIYDISDIENPERVATIADSNATVHNVQVVGNLAFTSYYTAGFKVFDVTDPAQPELVDEYDTDPEHEGEGFGSGAFGVYALAPSGNVYISDYNSGLHVLSVDLASSAPDDEPSTPSSFALLANYPNPFNPKTRITYRIGQAGPVELTVYNTLGRRVRELVNETKAAGTYEITWDGSNDSGVGVASGIYFYRLKAGKQFNQVRRMLLLK